MGVEYGMPDFASADIFQALPSACVRPVLLHPDVQGDEEDEMPTALETNAFSNLMPNDIIVHRVCHAIHNATKDLD